jgi:hypothetical protein
MRKIRKWVKRGKESHGGNYKGTTWLASGLEFFSNSNYPLILSFLAQLLSLAIGRTVLLLTFIKYNEFGFVFQHNSSRFDFAYDSCGKSEGAGI